MHAKGRYAKLARFAVVGLLAAGVSGPAMTQPAASDKQIAAAAFMWFFADNSFTAMPFERLGAALAVYEDEKKEGSSTVPEVREVDEPDRAVTADVEGSDYVPAGKRTSTNGTRIFTSAQGQEVTIDFNYQTDTKGGDVRVRGDVDGSVTTTLCPNAGGAITGKFRIETKSRLSARGASINAANEFQGTFQAMVGDDALIKTLAMQADVVRTMDLGGREARSSARFRRTSKLVPATAFGKDSLERTGDPELSVESVSEWDDSPDFHYAYAMAWANLESALYRGLLPRVQDMFRNNYCVQLQYRGLAEENHVAPLSVTNTTVAVKHRFENRDLPLPATHRIAGEGKFAPGAMASTPAPASYTAPAASNNPAFPPSARIYGKSVSKRGIGRASVYFSADKKADEAAAPSPKALPPLPVFGATGPVSGVVRITGNTRLSDTRRISESQPTLPGETAQSSPTAPGYVTQTWNMRSALAWRFQTMTSRLDGTEAGARKYFLTGRDWESVLTDWESVQITMDRCSGPRFPALESLHKRTNKGKVLAERTNVDRAYSSGVYLKVIGTGAARRYEFALPQAIELRKYGEGASTVVTETSGCGYPAKQSTSDYGEAFSLTSAKGWPEPILRGTVGADGSIKGRIVLPRAYQIGLTYTAIPPRKPVPMDVVVEIDMKVRE